jgi:hypothetical protein
MMHLSNLDMQNFAVAICVATKLVKSLVVNKLEVGL